MRRLAAATPVGLIETSGGQEDVQSFAWEAAGKLRAALRHARVVTACELLAGYQAAALSGRPAARREPGPAGLAGRHRRSDRRRTGRSARTSSGWPSRWPVTVNSRDPDPVR